MQYQILIIYSGTQISQWQRDTAKKSEGERQSEKYGVSTTDHSRVRGFNGGPWVSDETTDRAPSEAEYPEGSV